jgi:hypothetical protein
MTKTLFEPKYGSRREFRGLTFSFNGLEYCHEYRILTVHLRFQDEEPQCCLTWWEDIDCCAEADIVLNEDSVMVHEKEFGNLEDLITWFGENI